MLKECIGMANTYCIQTHGVKKEHECIIRYQILWNICCSLLRSTYSTKCGASSWHIRFGKLCATKYVCVTSSGNGGEYPCPKLHSQKHVLLSVLFAGLLSPYKRLHHLLYDEKTQQTGDSPSQLSTWPVYLSPLTSLHPRHPHKCLYVGVCACVWEESEMCMRPNHEWTEEHHVE